jgi:hypothetical protein
MVSVLRTLQGRLPASERGCGAAVELIRYQESGCTRNVYGSSMLAEFKARKGVDVTILVNVD